MLKNLLILSLTISMLILACTVQSQHERLMAKTCQSKPLSIEKKASNVDIYSPELVKYLPKLPVKALKLATKGK